MYNTERVLFLLILPFNSRKYSTYILLISKFATLVWNISMLTFAVFILNCSILSRLTYLLSNGAN